MHPCAPPPHLAPQDCLSDPVRSGPFLSGPRRQAQGLLRRQRRHLAGRQRIVFIEFAADGTALLQQKWVNKDPQTWHARWKQEKKKITLTYDPAKDTPLPDPLIFNFKHGN